MSWLEAIILAIILVVSSLVFVFLVVITNIGKLLLIIGLVLGCIWFVAYAIKDIYEMYR